MVVDMQRFWSLHQPGVILDLLRGMDMCDYEYIVYNFA